MNIVFERIRNQHYSIYKIALFIGAIFIAVYLMPRKKSFSYELMEGKPWLHDNFISDMEFSILKPQALIDLERQQIIDKQKYVFYKNDKVVEKALEDLNDEFANFYNVELENKPSLRSLKEHKKHLNEIEKKYKSLWQKIYKKGVLEKNGIINDRSGNYLIKLKHKDKMKDVYLNQLYTMDEASELVKSLAIDDENHYKQIVNMLLEAIVQNIKYNKSSSDDLHNQELKTLSKVSGKVEIGELIVSKGEVVDEHIYLKLKSYKLEYEEKQISNRANWFILIGQVLLLSICFLILYLFLSKYRKKLFEDSGTIKFILLNVLLFIALANIALLFSNKNSIFVIPFCVLPLVIRSFYDVRIALFVHTITILIVGWLAPDPFHFVFIQFMAGILSVLTIDNLYKRSDLFISVGKIALVYTLTYLSISFVSKGDIIGHQFSVYGYLLVSALLTLMTYPLAFIYEKIFSLVSDITLLELVDTNHPLLKEMSERSPGTFQHSLQVSNLAESAIMELGGNTLLVRAGAMYHDIGKVDNALFFIENQTLGMNPHEELSFDESAKVIINHVIRGIEKAKKHKLPEQVIDFIRTHHGDGLVQYFYKEYVKKYPDKRGQTEMFRYPGPKPFSKETAVLMMADAVEAASRSLPEKNMTSISALVDKIISSQMANGQFDRATISLREIALVKKIFVGKLLNIHHLRIEYPT